MDDNEKKNIDGIKPALQQDTPEKQGNNIQITSDDDTPNNDPSVSINEDGEIDNDLVVQEAVADTEIGTPEEVPTESDTVVSEEALHEDSTFSEAPDVSLEETAAIATPEVVQNAINEQPQPIAADAEVSKLKERNKHLRIWLAVLIILLVGLASALVVYFAQQSKAQSDLNAAKQENAALQDQIAQQQASATQSKITELQTSLDAEKAKNAELTAENKKLTETIAAYEIATEKLLELCGDKCSSVTIPDSITPTEATPPTN